MRWLLILCLLAALPAFAVQPDEVLADPVLEARARAISAELRCQVCRNESIDESNADLARDLRLFVRERLVAGDADEAVMDQVVARYGEYVLLRPRFSARNAALWLAGPILLILGGAVAVRFLRGQRGAGEKPLSKAEEARLARLLKDQAES